MNSVAPIKKHSWLTRTLVLVLLTVLCTGCVVKRYRAELKLLEAYIETPQKKYPLQLLADISEEQAKSGSSAKYMVVTGKTGNIRFSFGMRSGLSILHNDKKREIVFSEQDTFYQLNAGEKVMLNTQVEHRTPPKKYSGYSSSLRYSLPEPLSAYEFKTMQGGLTPSSIKTIKAGKRNKHRLYIPFTVDGEPYVVDITFKVKLHGDYYVEVPGTP